uniref:Uncharacterized protein n=1 Tax=Anopheles atroparvus TaxID=41427 RepID=A0A182J3D6_ANOAO
MVNKTQARCAKLLHGHTGLTDEVFVAPIHTGQIDDLVRVVLLRAAGRGAVDPRARMANSLPPVEQIALGALADGRVALGAHDELITVLGMCQHLHAGLLLADVAAYFFRIIASLRQLVEVEIIRAEVEDGPTVVAVVVSSAAALVAGKISIGYALTRLLD